MVSKPISHRGSGRFLKICPLVCTNMEKLFGRKVGSLTEEAVIKTSEQIFVVHVKPHVLLSPSSLSVDTQDGLSRS